MKKRDTESTNKPPRMMPTAVANYGSVFLNIPSLRSKQKLYTRNRIRLLKSRIKREHLGIMARTGLLLLPSISIPFAELSLSTILHSPIIIPSPIRMELFDTCTTMLHSSVKYRNMK